MITSALPAANHKTNKFIEHYTLNKTKAFLQLDNLTPVSLIRFSFLSMVVYGNGLSQSRWPHKENYFQLALQIPSKLFITGLEQEPYNKKWTAIIYMY